MAKSKQNKKKNAHKVRNNNNPLAQVRADALKALEEKRAPAAKAVEAEDNIPRCLVARRGRLGKYARELIADLRLVMSPYTPTKLKDKRNNTIKDYVAVSGVLGLTHLMTISQTANGPNLGLARIPRGPTLSFKIRHFAPCSFLRRTLKKGTGENSKTSFSNPPLVVLNNFDDPENGRHVKIIAVTFQALFPAINVKTVKLNECRRVILVNYHRESDSLDVRHYLIRADPQGASRSVRKLLKAKVPNLSGRTDVSEIIDPGLRFGAGGGETSDSEVEDAAASVSLPQSFPGRGNQAGKRSVVKLREIGPRLTLELVKVQEGIFDGEVQYHKYESRTEEEIKAQRSAAVEKEHLVEERRRQQEENVEKKRLVEEEKNNKKKARLEARKTRLLERAKKYTAEGGEVGPNRDEKRQKKDDDEGSDADEDNDADEAEGKEEGKEEESLL